jgi:hypothetical protein
LPLRAAIPPRIIEAATSIEVVGQETAVFELTFDKPASRERATSKVTTVKFDSDKSGGIEQCPVDVALPKRRVEEGRGDMQSFATDALEFTENENLFLPGNPFRQTSLKDFACDLHLAFPSMKVGLPLLVDRQGDVRHGPEANLGSCRQRAVLQKKFFAST